MNSPFAGSSVSSAELAPALVVAVGSTRRPKLDAVREFAIVNPGENNFKQVVEKTYGKI